MSNKTKTPHHSRHLLLGSETFMFSCNEDQPCFTLCCKNADMFLYPYDIIRLKQHLGLSSEQFLTEHTITAYRSNPNFPDTMLKMSDLKENPCSFLTPKGCTVYENRPYSCRAYPLEPGMYGKGDNQIGISCYLVQHDHCKGHGNGAKWTAETWMSDQGMKDYNQKNMAWARVAALLQNSPALAPKKEPNPALNMAYMASYNMDTFRRFVFESSFLNRYNVSEDRIALVRTDDVALMHLGFDWILRFIGNQGTLKEKTPR